MEKTQNLKQLQQILWEDFPLLTHNHTNGEDCLKMLIPPLLLSLHTRHQVTIPLESANWNIIAVLCRSLSILAWSTEQVWWLVKAVHFTGLLSSPSPWPTTTRECPITIENRFLEKERNFVVLPNAVHWQELRARWWLCVPQGVAWNLWLPYAESKWNVNSHTCLLLLGLLEQFLCSVLFHWFLDITHSWVLVRIRLTLQILPSPALVVL